MPHSANGNLVISVEQIISKLDVASDENVKLRNALHANNQLLDQKLRQFESLFQENASEHCFAESAESCNKIC